MLALVLAISLTGELFPGDLGYIEESLFSLNGTASDGFSWLKFYEENEVLALNTLHDDIEQLGSGVLNTVKVKIETGNDTLIEIRDLLAELKAHGDHVEESSADGDLDSPDNELGSMSLGEMPSIYTENLTWVLSVNNVNGSPITYVMSSAGPGSLQMGYTQMLAFRNVIRDGLKVLLFVAFTMKCARLFS